MERIIRFRWIVDHNGDTPRAWFCVYVRVHNTANLQSLAECHLGNLKLKFNQI